MASRINTEEYTPYKKKSKKRTPKKANHKHEFVDCIFTYDRLRLDEAHGFQPQPDEWFGKYCYICGRVGSFEYDKWIDLPRGTFSVDRKYCTEEARRELNPQTRTLPTFRVDEVLSQKYVDLDCNITK